MKLVNKLSVRYTPNPEGVEWNPAARLASIDQCKRVAGEFLRHETQEVFALLLLDHHAKLIGFAEVYRGTSHSVTAEPAAVAKFALLANASAVVLCHNHPGETGVPLVSEVDVAATANITDILQSLSIEVVDHIVVGLEAEESIMCEPGEETQATVRKVLAARNPLALLKSIVLGEGR